MVAAEDQSLAAVIRRWVTPDAWGHDGAEVVADGTVVHVTAPPDTQAQIERFVADRMVQVSVTTRLLTLRPSQVRAAGLDVPAAGVVDPIGSDAVAALVRAVARGPSAISLVAPRLTLYTGQRGELIVETQQAYVSGLTPVVAPGAALFDPTVSTTPASGLRETVRGTVTPDRLAVDLTVHVECRRLLSLDPVTMTAKVGGQSISGTMQMPHQSTVVVDAGLHLPTGGSALVRGTTAETYSLDGHPPVAVATTHSADPDAAEAFVVWTATVVPPPTPATRPADGARLR
jgi:hypothetical protein